MRLSLEQVITQYGSSIYNAAFSLLCRPEDAQDAAQDTLLRYYMSNKEFHTEEHLRAWLLRTAINRAKDMLRSAERRRTCSLEEYADIVPFPVEELRDVFLAVMSLPELYRPVIHLYYYEECSVKEVASLLHLTQGAVKTRLRRGRQMLKETLKEEWNDE